MLRKKLAKKVLEFHRRKAKVILGEKMLRKKLAKKVLEFHRRKAKVIFEKTGIVYLLPADKKISCGLKRVLFSVS